MSDNETHYQVALTNGQVLGAFALLLGCLLAVFFAGVWLGRGSVTENEAREVAGAREVTDEFAFFSGDERSSAEPKPRQPRSATTTAAEDAPAPEVMEPGGAARSPAPDPVPSSSATVAGSESFTIQVFATADEAKAQALVDRLVDADFRAFLSPSDDPGRLVYRVRVGPLPSRQLAEAQAAELQRRWGLESWISAGDA